MAFDKCDFIITEINHDLNSSRANPKITNKLFKEDYFKGIAALNLDEGGCRGKKSNNFFNDESIVEQIFIGKSKGDLQHMADGDYTTDVRTNAGTRQLGLRKLSCTRSLLPEYITLFDQDHVFLVIDTDNKHIVQNLIKYYNGGTQVIPTLPQIHIIHTALTLADSAPKTKPDDKNYINKTGRPQQIDVNSWYYTKELTIPSDSRLFMTHYAVKNSLVAGSNWDIQQQWILPETVAGKQDFFTLNAKIDNNVPAVTARIGKNNFDSRAILPDQQKEVNLCIQRKRSGDYFQIWMASHLPQKLTANNFEESQMLHVRPTQKPRKFPIEQTKKWYKERTYFVTGDYPAFCYAVYMQINCYFNPPIPNGYIMRAQF